MKTSFLFKLLSNIVVILIMLYFTPFFGVCLIVLRCFMSDNRKRSLTPLYIMGVGLLILFPKVLYLVFDLVKLDLNKVPYINDILHSEVYNTELLNYSKRLMCVGIIFLMISFILDNLSSRLNGKIRDYICEAQRRQAEILKQNDMEIKIKQEKAKNTSYVKCPSCGADNLLGEKFGTCEYCRGKIENKSYKG